MNNEINEFEPRNEVKEIVKSMIKNIANISPEYGNAVMDVIGWESYHKLYSGEKEIRNWEFK